MFPGQAPYPNFNTTIAHFTHPGHLLTELNSNSEYLCKGCRTPGNGSRFRCNPCDFDLHEYCGKCPNVLASFMHPVHQLALHVRKSQDTNSQNCDICNGSLEGLFYWCKDCEFNVHPLCTQLPQFLRLKLHDAHPLTLQAPKTAIPCIVCRATCDANSWRYRCGDCGWLDIHMECVLVVSEGLVDAPVPSPSHQSRRLPSYAGEYVYAGVSSGSNYHPTPAYNNMDNYGYDGVASGSNVYYNIHSPAYANPYQVPAAYNQPSYAGEYVFAGVPSGSNYHQAPAYNNMHNYGYGGVASDSNIYYNMHSPAYVNPYQVPAAHNQPSYDCEYVYAGVPSGSNYHQAPTYNNNYGYSGSNVYYNMHSPAYANPYQVPAAFNHPIHNYPHHQGQEGGQPANGSLWKRMYSLVGKLALGVASNVIFGIGFPDLN